MLCRMAFVYSVDGDLKRKIKMMRINDLALTRDGSVMVTVNQEKLIKVQRLTDSKDVRVGMSDQISKRFPGTICCSPV